MSRRTVVFLVAWLAAAAGAGATLFLLQPTGPMTWVLWLVAGPPTYILVRGAVELMVQTFFAAPGIKQATRYFEKRAEGKQVSGPRMLWYIFAFAPLFVVAVAIVAPIYGYVSDLLEQDRCLDAGGRWRAEQQACESADTR
jgi:Na+/proline symporter